MVTRKSRAEIERMRRAGRIVAEVLALVEDELKPGVTTGHLDRIAEAHIRKAGAIPSFKGYPGINPRRPFPGSLCISIDDEIVHGIPGERAIREGQVVSIDAGAIVEGWHGDAARTFYRRRAAGRGPPADRHDPRGDDGRHRRRRSRQPHRGHLGRRRGRGQGRTGSASSASSSGTGSAPSMHEEPQVPNYRTGRRGRKLEPGLCLAIEPMFTLGDYRAHVLADDWTVSTVDGSLAAHFEDSIAITEGGPEILTAV